MTISFKQLLYKKFFLLQGRVDQWKKFEIGAIVISPTRELATQISKVLEQFLKNIPDFKQILLVGGTTVKEDISRLTNGANIIVATPGRLEDIFNIKEVNLIGAVKNMVSELIYNVYNCFTTQV